MAAKKFSLKDNPIFESTAIPVKKDREKHPLNAVYSPSEKTKRKASDKLDKVREWSAKKINNKALSFGVIALLVIPSLYIISWWREISKIDHPAPLTPLTTEVRPLMPEAEHVQKPEELLPEEALPVIEELPPAYEEEELLPAHRRRLRDERWLLSAIIFDGANSRALLNRRIVRKGDILQGDVKVTEITPNSVVLARGEETFTIKLETNN